MKILCVKPKFETAVSFYRGTPVMHELCRANGWELDVLPAKDITPDQIYKYDIFFDIRPTSDESIYCIYLAKSAGIKVWIDIDDLLWKIPGSNIVSRSFSENSKTNLTRAILNADIVTVSTDTLAEQINLEFGVMCVVIPNAWNDRVDDLHGKWNAPEEGQSSHILWRGSTTHTGDLLDNREYFQESEDYYFTFMGEFPTFFFKKYGGGLEKINWQSWRDNIFEYFQVCQQLKPQYFFFPLEDNLFNRCKSNIAWIEATMAGAVCIASKKMPEFKKVPCIYYESYDNLNDIINNKALAENIFRESINYLREVLRLSIINEQRAGVVNFLMNKK